MDNLVPKISTTAVMFIFSWRVPMSPARPEMMCHNSYWECSKHPWRWYFCKSTVLQMGCVRMQLGGVYTPSHQTWKHKLVQKFRSCIAIIRDFSLSKVDVTLLIILSQKWSPLLPLPKVRDDPSTLGLITVTRPHWALSHLILKRLREPNSLRMVLGHLSKWLMRSL